MIYRHHYPDTSEEADLTARQGQTVEIIRPLTGNEADLEYVGPMFRVRFPDGFEADVFEDELQEEGG